MKHQRMSQNLVGGVELLLPLVTIEVSIPLALFKQPRTKLLVAGRIALKLLAPVFTPEYQRQLLRHRQLRPNLRLFLALRH